MLQLSGLLVSAALVAPSGVDGAAATTNDGQPTTTSAVAPEAPAGPAAPAVASALDEAPSFAGSFPGSFLIPGTDLSIKVGGRFKLDAIHDFDAIGTTDEFKTSSIPVPEESSDGNTRFHARDTRLHLEVRTPSAWGEIRGYVEGNFFGSGNSFELRHAYAQTDRLLAGQTWTNFMLIDSHPETLDFEGPDSSIFLRQAQVRWTQPVGDGTHWSIALEDPSSDVELPVDTSAEQVFPDLTTGLRWDGSRGHTYLSAILREIAYDGAESDSVIGWGASLSGRIDTHDKDNVRYQLAYGQGIARYIQDLRGLGLDAGPDGDGDLEALPTYGGFLAYQHFWNEELRSSAMFATTGVDNSAGQPATALESTSYAAANLIWKAAERLEIGVEVLRGTRENNDGEDADANRVQFSLTYSF